MKQNNTPTMVELALIITLFLSMCLITLSSMSEIKLQTEKAQFERTLQHIQNTLDIFFTQKQNDNHFLAGFSNIHRINPITFLKRPPINYLGSFDKIPADQVAAGHWFYLEPSYQLVYTPTNKSLFISGFHDKPHITFEIKAQYQDNNQNQQFDQHEDYATGIILKNSDVTYKKPDSSSFF